MRRFGGGTPPDWANLKRELGGVLEGLEFGVDQGDKGEGVFDADWFVY